MMNDNTYPCFQRQCSSVSGGHYAFPIRPMGSHCNANDSTSLPLHKDLPLYRNFSFPFQSDTFVLHHDSGKETPAGSMMWTV
jgi:hypothetical protein